MKATLRELLDLLGVEEDFGPYDSRMWSADDESAGATCTAQASMNAEGNEVEASVELVYLNPAPGTPAAQQIMFMHARQDMNKKWLPDILRVKGELQHGKIYDWEKKAGEFFITTTMQLARGTVPDFDELIERIFKSSDGYASGGGGGGSRKPVIRPEQLLDPTKRF